MAKRVLVMEIFFLNVFIMGFSYCVSQKNKTKQQQRNTSNLKVPAVQSHIEAFLVLWARNMYYCYASNKIVRKKESMNPLLRATFLRGKCTFFAVDAIGKMRFVLE